MHGVKGANGDDAGNRQGRRVERSRKAVTFEAITRLAEAKDVLPTFGPARIDGRPRTRPERREAGDFRAYSAPAELDDGLGGCPGRHGAPRPANHNAADTTGASAGAGPNTPECRRPLVRSREPRALS